MDPSGRKNPCRHRRDAHSRSRDRPANAGPLVGLSTGVREPSGARWYQRHRDRVATPPPHRWGGRDGRSRRCRGPPQLLPPDADSGHGQTDHDAVGHAGLPLHVGGGHDNKLPNHSHVRSPGDPRRRRTAPLLRAQATAACYTRAPWTGSMLAVRGWGRDAMSDATLVSSGGCKRYRLTGSPNAERSHRGLVRRFAKPLSGVTCSEGSNPSLSASSCAPVAQWIERQVADLKAVSSSLAGRATSSRLAHAPPPARPPPAAVQARQDSRRAALRFHQQHPLRDTVDQERAGRERHGWSRSTR